MSKPKFTQKELIEEIASTLGITKKLAKDCLAQLCVTVQQKVNKGYQVQLPLGTFQDFITTPRLGTNPITKERIQIPSKRIPKFRASKSFKGLEQQPQ